MAEEKATLEQWLADIVIKKCESGFLVRGDQYGGVGYHAFSTPEGLIEWLSRELGAGPIVWSLTLPIWADIVQMKEEDLLPIPDQGTDPKGYQEAQQDNAAILITRFAEAVIASRKPKPKPAPKPKKEKKPKEEKGAGVVEKKSGEAEGA